MELPAEVSRHRSERRLRITATQAAAGLTAPPYFAYWRGNKMRKVVPTPVSELMSIVASNKSHNRFTMDRPSPSPLARLSDETSSLDRLFDVLPLEGSL